jgi:hypothetical protein
MAKAKLMEVYNGLPNWAKGVVVVGLLGVTYIVGSQVLSAIRRKKDEKKQLEEINVASNDLNALSRAGVKPTLSNSAYEAISAAIIDAVNGCGTSMAKILSQFEKMKNDADVLMLIKVFGLRKKQRCVFSDDPREDFWSSQTPPMSLTAHLQSDLSVSDINEINKTLSKKGIKYQF